MNTCLAEQRVRSKQAWINDVLSVRVGRMGLKIEDLFMVLHCLPGEEGDMLVETDYGRLLTFFCSHIPDTKHYILHKGKWKYPRKGTSFQTKQIIN